MLLTRQEARGSVKRIIRTHFPGMVLRQVSRPELLRSAPAWLLADGGRVLLVELTDELRAEASLLLPSAGWKRNNAIYVLRLHHHAVFEVPIAHGRLERTLLSFLADGPGGMLDCCVCEEQQGYVNSCTACDAPVCMACVVARAVPVPLTRLSSVRCPVCGAEDVVELRPLD